MGTDGWSFLFESGLGQRPNRECGPVIRRCGAPEDDLECKRARVLMSESYRISLGCSVLVDEHDRLDDVVQLGAKDPIALGDVLEREHACGSQKADEY